MGNRFKRTLKFSIIVPVERKNTFPFLNVVKHKRSALKTMLWILYRRFNINDFYRKTTAQCCYSFSLFIPLYVFYLVMRFIVSVHFRWYAVWISWNNILKLQLILCTPVVWIMHLQLFFHFQLNCIHQNQSSLMMFSSTNLQDWLWCMYVHILLCTYRNCAPYK